MKACKRVIYSGTVQGVGFRWTTHGVAAHYTVTGYVRNMASGDVELVAEGEPAEVDRFLVAVEERMAGYISGKDVQDQPPGNYRGFAITR